MRTSGGCCREQPFHIPVPQSCCSAAGLGPSASPPSGVTGSSVPGSVQSFWKAAQPSAEEFGRWSFLPVEQDPAVLYLDDQVSRRKGLA